MYRLIIIALLFAACTRKNVETATNQLYHERYRPQYHFSPAQNWTNDPNGLVYYKDEYHLFFQYNPLGDKWGHMSWGHAVSKDLLHWEQLPVAIGEYANPSRNDSTMIFSGTVVVDSKNTSGLCTGSDCLIAIYTAHVHRNGQGVNQNQSLAYSNDQGRTWQRYANNPVLDIKRKDFRDPKVFWYEPKHRWIMAVVIPDEHKIQFYQSEHLTEWNLSGEFGNVGDTTKIWECPDVFPVSNGEQAIQDSPWVLTLSGNHPAGGPYVGMQYFVGKFNGDTFIANDKGVRYVDYGKDFYAGIVINNRLKEGPTMIGWAQNWAYAPRTPTSPWRGAMSLPRNLSSDDHSGGLRQYPFFPSELRGNKISSGSKISGQSLELQIEMMPEDSRECGVKVLKSEGEETIIGYNVESHEMFVDRTHSGNVSFDQGFASIERAKVEPVDGKIHLQILIDHSIIEIFVNHGTTVFTECVYPTKEEALVETYSKEGAASFNVDAWEMRSIWK
jgi:fructan beta-fructosidase